jgi:hypothetical protein
MRIIVLSVFLFSLFSCKRKWTDKDKNDFYSGCMNGAVSNKEVTDPKSYCNCLLEKVVAKYPNANDAKYIRYDSSVRRLAKDCLHQP